jgi:Fe-S cluster assembly iron-binding protein IscA
MVYISPFEGLKSINYGLEYSGTLDQVLTELGLVSLSEDAPSAKIRALHPPRIIRAAIEYKIKCPGSVNAEEILKDAIASSLYIYSHPEEAAATVQQFRSKVQTLGLEDLLTEQIIQLHDSVTKEATESRRSQETVQRLISNTEGNDVLFIALAHGGVAAGMDVYLKYCEETGSKNSAFYAVRFSIQKMKDEQPQLTQTEIEYLKGLSKGREIVLFDEDVSTGETRKRAYDYISSHVFNGQQAMFVTNLNGKKPLLLQLNGERTLKNVYTFSYPDAQFPTPYRFKPMHILKAS